MKGRLASRIRLVGFLIVPLGILTASAPATPLDEALGRLDRLEQQRSRLLAEADSLGRLLQSLPSDKDGEGEDDPPTGGASREALHRRRCRDLAGP